MTTQLPPAPGLTAWYQQGRLEQHGAHRLFLADAGAGSAVLCLHGFPTASWDWSRLWAGLVCEHRALAPDMLGFGFSDKPRGHPYRVMEQADLIESVVAQRLIRRVHLLCHDLGDTVGQELMARQQDGVLSFEVRSVCYLNGGLIPGAHRPRMIQRLLAGPAGPVLALAMSRRRFKRSFSAVFGPETGPDDAELDRFWRLLTHNGGRRVQHRLIAYMAERLEHESRWLAALKQTRVPQCLINGLEDPVSGRHALEAYEQLVPAARTHALPGIGHYPQFEAPAQVLAAWRSFRPD